MFDKKARAGKAVSSSSVCAAPPRNLTPKNHTLVKTGSGPERTTGNFWPKDLTPYPFQLTSVDWALAKRVKTYLALKPGLGKTICAAIILNKLNAKAPTKAFYVCPPFLVSNTSSEFLKWCGEKCNLYLIPDSMLAKAKTIADLENALDLWPGEKILFIDEAHRFKNEGAKRSRALFTKILPHFERVVFLSGTPLPNSRPVELWPILKHAAPDIFGTNFFRFGMKYCGGFKTPFGWDFSGFTNRKEFKARLMKSFMLRMNKDVLNLPPKREGLLTVGDRMPPVVSNVEKEILKHYTKEDLVEGKVAALAGKDSLHMATYMRLLGEYKLKYVLPVIEEILEETKENILIFAVHKETIAKLQYALSEYKPLVITGDVHKDKRQGLVKEYQENPKRRVFIGNVAACGVGFTLTKATRVLFVEFSWVDGDNEQASDRAHRIGTTESVLVQYVVLKDSIDARRMGVLLNKRNLSI